MRIPLFVIVRVSVTAFTAVVSDNYRIFGNQTR